ncbi:RhoGAP-domain-containing protein [Pleurotus pulmonarius]
MSDDQDQGRAQYPWSNPQLNSQNALHGLSVNPDVSRSQRPPNQQRYDARSPYSAPAGNPGRLPERPNLPTRSSTVGTPDPDRNQNADDLVPHARSEDLNHGYYGAPLPGSSPTQDSNYLSANSRSRPSTPGSSSNRNNPSSSSGHSDESDRRLSVTSFSSAQSGSSSQSGGTRAPPTTASSTSASVSASAIASSACASCGKPMSGSFVRALGTVFHLDCFKCMDCGEVVANKFFPFEGSEGSQQPLCERDYFRRLNLICAKCNMALRGSYITACNKKFHVEHFTCSLCPTLFGPQDSYYEHDGNVYCHFHYSTRFATKCAGCSSAILKQFVEINRNSRDECWHPECYMINKFWNVKVSSRRPTSTTSVDTATALSFTDDEQRDTPSSLKERQIRMEQQVYRIWTVLSAFEESSAACISDMLRQVSNGQYLDAIRMAEKFILHVEVLFATIDDLEYHFLRLNQKGMSHVREARMLCRKTVELFTLLSHTQETGARRMGMTQELLALVTGLAHYLKILIRIALTGALKLEREQSVNEAMSGFLDKLHLLAVQGGNPSARRLLKGSNGELLHSNGGNIGTQGVAYGFRSLAPENAGESPFSNTGPSKLSPTNPPSDLCVKCGVTVEEDCVAAAPIVKEPKGPDEKDKDGQPPKLSTARRPPANVGAFVYDPASMGETTSFGDVPTIIYCTDHAHSNCRSGFQAVQRLEQYAFLLNVALRRLYLLLKKQGVVPLSPVTNHASPYSDTTEASDPYRNNNDIMRMKSVHLDRKLSATAHLPKRSTIVESPAGRTAHPHDVLKPQKSQELGVAQSQRSAANVPPAHHGSQGQVHHHHHALQPGGRSPQLTSQPAPAGSARPQLGRLPIDSSQGGQVLRPSFARNNTEVMIVDDSTPNSPAGGAEDALLTSVPDDGITLADIPQLMERAQAREQHRPRQHAVPFVADLSALELTIVKHTALLALSRSPLKDQFDLDDILESLENKKGGFWNKLLFKANDKKIKKKGVFGVPLELLVEREGADSLLGASRATLRVPSFIDDVISAMRQMDMSVEGIFRKNGNIRHLKDLTEAIDRDPSSVDLSSDHPVQLAALLKKFLRDLPDPLLTFKLHRLLIVTQSLPQEADRRRYLHLVSLLLPKSHRDTMEVLFVFLKWVASFAHMDEETGSKMDLGNLATVICPSILYSRGRDPARDESFGAIRVVTALLEDQDLFLTVPEDFLDIINDKDYFASAVDLPGKDFMRKCDTWLRSKGRAGASNGPPHNQRPPPGSPYPERPPLGHSVSERTARPPPHSAPPGTPQGNGALYLPPSALQSMSLAQAQTPPQSHEWRPPLPPSDSNLSRSPMSRPSFDQANMLPPSTNGYTPAVQQRT